MAALERFHSITLSYTTGYRNTFTLFTGSTDRYLSQMHQRKPWYQKEALEFFAKAYDFSQQT